MIAEVTLHQRKVASLDGDALARNSVSILDTDTSNPPGDF
ncbi:hypothetical protein BN1221_04424 [Brenneria goodwinii]|uniref:Uncharacterized protein n=1 Tax=Brenneria goodwinii TaxID=1109412 RepID=A0A0G4K1B9_9GAMM|nr:hypothetical protein BN1221_04424 [Brenneria goodwinii]